MDSAVSKILSYVIYLILYFNRGNKCRTGFYFGEVRVKTMKPSDHIKFLNHILLEEVDFVVSFLLAELHRSLEIFVRHVPISGLKIQ